MEETQSLEKSKKPGRFTAVEKTSGKFYSSDIKSAQSNLSIDSPSTSGGIGVYHSDNLLPSTSTKKLFDDKKSEDTGDFVRFVTKLMMSMKARKVAIRIRDPQKIHLKTQTKMMMTELVCISLMEELKFDLFYTSCTVLI
ncbi:hypothetical protein CDAR_227812 [Caerostris darwini]|uniref:Uncharacterized protein n=1 Tax=Caerostris darwini TaxID=1538125 RepID=A0AAV4WKU4_9ARAC|nr:hypothetical protein CDAR_227812 [Caerostris darwini]